MTLIKCSECSAEVSDKATACPRCGYPLAPQNAYPLPPEAPTSQPNEPLAKANSKRKKKSRGLRVFFALFGVALVLIVISAFTDPNTVAIGQNAVLRWPGQEDVTVATTQADFAAMTKAAAANDAPGLRQMYADGDLFIVPNGTRVLMLDSGVFAYEVRILDGKYAGRSGYVTREYAFAK